MSGAKILKACVCAISLAFVLIGLADCKSTSTAGMVEIPAGWFTMGSDSGPSSSQPAHLVYLDASAIERTEVTNKAFQKYVSATGNTPLAWQEARPPGVPDEPVAGILWREALAYCEWAGMRLPSEAEWEKAARGTDQRLYPWGDRWDSRRANTAQSSKGVPVPVGSYPDGASPYGVLDLAGNLAEWVADFYEPTYYANSPERNPSGPQKVLDHGLRGGSWESPPEQATTSFRDSSHGATPNLRVGFRCAISR